MDYLQYKDTRKVSRVYETVLNLVINGLPSILWIWWVLKKNHNHFVLNLVINGLPSILIAEKLESASEKGYKF